jgi:hypothetical protein
VNARAGGSPQQSASSPIHPIRLAITSCDLKGPKEALEGKYDAEFKVVFDAIRALMEPPEDEEPEKTPIGFRAD